MVTLENMKECMKNRILDGVGHMTDRKDKISLLQFVQQFVQEMLAEELKNGKHYVPITDTIRRD